MKARDGEKSQDEPEMAARVRNVVVEEDVHEEVIAVEAVEGVYGAAAGRESVDDVEDVISDETEDQVEEHRDHFLFCPA